MNHYILGLSFFYHDSAAVLLKNGDIVAAAQEERFTRKKNDASFPKNAIEYCLNSEDIDIKDIQEIVYYEKPLLTFERLLETYLETVPRGGRSFIAAMQVWLKKKLFLKTTLKNNLKEISKDSISTKSFTNKLFFSQHHLSHAAAAFFPSPFKESVILCMDGVGEWVTTSAWIGKKNTIKPLWEISFPHSLGLLYSAFTYYCGFKVNSGEYKLMGLAPYGKPIYIQKIKKYLIDIKEDGTFRLDISYFKFHRGFRMTGRKFHKLFGQSPRKPEHNIEQFHMDIAASIQLVTEEIVLKLSKSLREETGIKNLCMAGGVALNCVANGKLSEKKIFDNIWIQPASGDAGSALGAALVGWHILRNKKRDINPRDRMKGAYLGPDFNNDEIVDYLNKINASFKTLSDTYLFELLADELDKGKVIGWFNGRMEFGPRALGARSIIGDPRNHKMQSIMNQKIKFRESFRPFAPSVLEEEANSQFKINVVSPYMMLVANLQNNLWEESNDNEDEFWGIDKLKIKRTKLPAITHVDYSARIQTVSNLTNPRFHSLIKAFKDKTGCPAVINTSFNVRGEPIVCNPQDAFRCFMRTEMDILVLENQILFKCDQSAIEKDETWKQKFELD